MGKWNKNTNEGFCDEEMLACRRRPQTPNELFSAWAR